MIELVIAMSVTALVGVATVGMLNAVSVGVDTQHDSRSVTIRSHHAQSRLAAYITPSRCILHRDASAIVLWFDDSRKSNTVHISEVRWLIFDPDEGAVFVHYVTFPPSFTDRERARYDGEYPATSDWMDLLTTYQSHAQLTMESRKLIDGLGSMTVHLDTGSDALNARHVTCHLTFATRNGDFKTIAAAAIRHHRHPTF
jgi:hypothetical protein